MYPLSNLRVATAILFLETAPGFPEPSISSAAFRLRRSLAILIPLLCFMGPKLSTMNYRDLRLAVVNFPSTGSLPSGWRACHSHPVDGSPRDRYHRCMAEGTVLCRLALKRHKIHAQTQPQTPLFPVSRMQRMHPSVEPESRQTSGLYSQSHKLQAAFLRGGRATLAHVISAYYVH